MALKLYEETDIAAIASAIRAKVGGSGTYSVSASTGNTKMATAVSNIPSGANLGTKSITENGTYNASSDNLDGYSSVTVNVSGGSSLPANIKSGTFTVAADASSQTITHGGSSAPKYIVWLPVVPLSSVLAKYTIGGFYDTPSASKCGIFNTVAGAVQTNVSYATVDNVGATTFDIIQRDASYPIKAGQYIFFAWFDS